MHPPTLPAETSIDAAGFWPRSVAWLIDAMLVSLPVWLVMSRLADGRFDALDRQWRALGTVLAEAMMAAALRGEAPFAMLQSWLSATGPLRPAIRLFVVDMYVALWPVMVLFVLIGLLYWPRQEAGRHHATLGKRAMGLQTTAGSGEMLDLRRACMRHIAGTVSWLTLNIGHMMAASSPHHQALHDRIAGTRVVWRSDARRKVPVWGWGLVLIAGAVPLLVAVRAALSLSAAMQAALGI